MARPTAIYFGLADDMIAEVASFDPRTIGIPGKNAKYLVTPIGDATWDTQWHATKADARADAADQARVYGVDVVRV